MKIVIIYTVFDKNLALKKLIFINSNGKTKKNLKTFYEIKKGKIFTYNIL